MQHRPVSTLSISDDQLAQWRGQLFMAARDTLLFIATTGTILDANPAAETLFGRSRARLIGTPIDSLFPGDAQPRWNNDLLTAATPWQGEIAFLRHDGLRGIGEVTLSRLEDVSGTCIAIACTLRDMTAWHQLVAEREAARVSELQARATFEMERGRMEALLNALPAGVALYDATGQMIQINPAGVQLTQRQARPGEAPEARHVRFSMRQLDGTPFHEDASPSGRARRGEMFTDVECIIDGLHGPETHLMTSGAPLRNLTTQEIEGAIVIFQDVTTLRHLEQAAQERQALADAMIDTSPFGIALYDATDAFVCLRHNGQFLQLVSPEFRVRGSLVGIPLDDLFDDASRARVRSVYAMVRSTKQPLYLDEFSAVLQPDPEPRWYKWSLSPVLGEAGQVIGLLNSAVEITELVRAREAIRQQAALLRTVLDVIPVGVAIADNEGHFLQVNEAFEAIWDAPGQGVQIGTHQPFLGWGPEDQPIGDADWALHRTLREQRPIVDEMIAIQSFAGMRKTILNSAAPITDASGQLIGGVVVEWDITARRALEQRTHTSLNALIGMTQSLISQNNEPLTTIARRLADVTAHVLGCKRIGVFALESETDRIQAITVVGLSAEDEAIWWQMQPVDARLRDEENPDLVRRFRAGENIIIDLSQPPFNTAPNPFGATIILSTPMVLDGQLVGFLQLDYGGVPHHFTPAELNLARGVASLAAIVFDRERLIAQRASAEAEALALARANHRMDEFMGIASHELRTPLTSLKMQTQIARRRVQPELMAMPAGSALARMLGDVDQLLVRSERSLDRLNRLVTDLVDTARIEAGTLQLDPAPCDLIAIVREMVEEQQLAVPDRQITFKAPQSPLPLAADAERIGQVVVNYLTNALKYSEASKPVEVRVSASRGTARVAVRDHGPGLPPEERELIWQRFHRAPGIETLSGSGVGLGLGLHICRTIILRHHGAVGVNSTVGVGSTFWFTLPLVTPHL